ncbi:nicotinate-nucleotide pyrophosphorylase [Steroidobacter denitrificans]|uniref:Probable nicotinate-nucleotide pyrophosphorylase [carboxylating] n=1 Tax=Steroidobacter denitrificans TaxID=465721 RepID=A0A127FD87_STEDE|nr:carboxylating nicotinate-nucleotide diphosphorylase [Steroidobacter denitrificans]AMN47660.1 nicotinate-nucleotide pyrophosphorylase [Steroidobacter denitrificans]
MDALLRDHITRTVSLALQEDIGDGDLTAALIPERHRASAILMTREDAVLCGSAWVDEVFHQLDARIDLRWTAGDGEWVRAGETLCHLEGPARALLTGERTALNFLQLLSATASVARRYVEALAGTGCRILDTRKTIPGLRLAQKYAVRCGGGVNHRIGLFDAILVKENHIAAAGSIAAAVGAARQLDLRNGPVMVEIEVENAEELRQALDAGVDRILLDNFPLENLRAAVATRNAHAHSSTELEASGNISLETLLDIARTGVDFISVGGLTKHLRAIDLSLRFG